MMCESPRVRRARVGVVLAAVLVLTGCSSPQLSSPVGEWVTVDGDHGTLSIRADGTFSMTDSSYNPLQYREADNDFDATGTWLMTPNNPDVKLNFKMATQGTMSVSPGGFDVSFNSGVIRLHDPDDVLDIEFRLTSD